MTDQYKIDRVSVDMAEAANSLRIMANAADGYHAAQHNGTYGAAQDAVRLALACGIAETSTVYFWDAEKAARRIVDEILDNGENVGYQLREVFAPGLAERFGLDFTVTVIESVTCDCGDPTCGCGCIPGNYPCEHGSMGGGCGS